MNKETTLSVFVDESGRFQYPNRESRFYIVGMVFHDQSADITQAIHDFKKSIYSLGLDPAAFVFHAGPLVRREKGYEFFSRNHRGKIYNRMMTFARRIDFRWHCLCVDKKYINSSLQIVSKLQAQLDEFIETGQIAPKKNNIGFSRPEVVKLRKLPLVTIRHEAKSETTGDELIRKNSIHAAAMENVNPTNNPQISALSVKTNTNASISVSKGQVEAVTRNPVLYTSPLPSTRCFAMMYEWYASSLFQP